MKKCKCGHRKEQHMEKEKMMCWKHDYCGCGKYKEEIHGRVEEVKDHDR